jgi:hypothetical protein
VNKICIFIGTAFGGYIGWWLGEARGWDFSTNFMLSGVGSLVGVYVSTKLARKFLD